MSTLPTIAAAKTCTTLPGSPETLGLMRLVLPQTGTNVEDTMAIVGTMATRVCTDLLDMESK